MGIKITAQDGEAGDIGRDGTAEETGDECPDEWGGEGARCCGDLSVFGIQAST